MGHMPYGAGGQFRPFYARIKARDNGIKNGNPIATLWYPFFYSATSAAGTAMNSFKRILITTLGFVASGPLLSFGQS